MSNCKRCGTLLVPSRDHDILECSYETRKLAEETVLRVRGSYDAHGFQACVEAEIERLKKL